MSDDPSRIVALGQELERLPAWVLTELREVAPPWLLVGRKAGGAAKARAVRARFRLAVALAHHVGTGAAEG